MGFFETILFYLLIGVCVASAVVLADRTAEAGTLAFRAITSVVFWPLYLPGLLQSHEPSDECTADRARSDVPTGKAPADDPLEAAIAQVEAELDLALTSLDGWAEDVLADEHGRFSELRRTWRWQADRIRELDRLLAQSDFLTETELPVSVSPDSAAASPTDGPHDDTAETHRFAASRKARRENIERLHRLRRKMYDDLLGTLAWVRELVTMIHLAKYTGAPASRAVELIEQIAASVEGLNVVSSWTEADAHEPTERQDATSPITASPARADGNTSVPARRSKLLTPGRRA